jgi:hypothetical protein
MREEGWTGTFIQSFLTLSGDNSLLLSVLENLAAAAHKGRIAGAGGAGTG